MDTITIKLVFVKIVLDMTFEPTKANVIALFAFINTQMAAADDPTAQIITGFSDRLKTTNDELEKAQT